MRGWISTYKLLRLLHQLMGDAHLGVETRKTSCFARKGKQVPFAEERLQECEIAWFHFPALTAYISHHSKASSVATQRVLASRCSPAAGGVGSSGAREATQLGSSVLRLWGWHLTPRRTISPHDSLQDSRPNHSTLPAAHAHTVRRGPVTRHKGQPGPAAPDCPLVSRD